MQALLIIDMQVEGFPPDQVRPEADAVIERINRLASSMRERGGPVIFIQHDGTREGDYIPGTPGWELLPALARHPEDMVIAKTANDSFYDTPLERVLGDAGVDELIVTGWATDFCVEATVRSALVRDFQVTVAGDAHICDDRPGITARQVIDHANWVWERLSPTRGSVRVLPTETILADAG